MEQGVDFVRRISQLKGISQKAVQDKLFKIKINGKLKKISNQLFAHKPKVILMSSEKEESLLEKMPK